MTSRAKLLSGLPGYDADADPLRIERLEVTLSTGASRPVDGVDLAVRSGETLAVLGESGSGKSMTARAVMGILPPGGRIDGGTIRVRGVDVLALTDEQRRRLRGSAVSMVFQDAMSALNPVLTVGSQIAEIFRVHQGLSRRDSHRRAIEMLDMVRLPSARERARDFPHQFSGGMRQRVMVAMALALEPQVVIADEPTTALDVTVQRQILHLLRELQRDRGMALVLITHDMGVVAEMADRVVVMYAGRVAEEAPVSDIFERPAHPYTEALLRAIPGPQWLGQRLQVIQGSPPSLRDVPGGCPFHPRCPRATDRCRTTVPANEPVATERRSACHYWRELVGR